MQPGSLSAIGDGELLELIREHERVDNQRAAHRNELVAELDRRRLAITHGCRDTATLLRHLLRLTPYEARARARAAEALGPRVSLSGEALEPIFPSVATALRSGEISPAHARIIVSTVDRLPTAVATEHGGPVEQTLTGHARDFAPDELAKLARRTTDLLDPDGGFKDAAHRCARRELTLCQRADGSASVRGELTTECAEMLATVLDTLARPNPGVDDQPDPRTARQRRHDGLQDGLRRILTSGTLPACGGVATTVIVTMSERSWRTGTGSATTSHGAVLPAAQAIGMAGGDAQVLAVALGSMREIVAYGDTHRIYRKNQRHALAARDGGCSFPGCTAPTTWCQIDHVVAFAKGGRSTVRNGHLVCGFHHRMKDRLGWTVSITDGLPTWTPPRWIDPQRRPRRNTAQHLELAFARRKVSGDAFA